LKRGIPVEAATETGRSQRESRSDSRSSRTAPVVPAERAGVNSSGCVAVVAPQHSTESFATLDLSSDSTNFFARINQLIAESLMIPFGVIVLKISSDNAAQ